MPTERRRPRFLAIQIKRIGDLILTTPALRVLRREIPDVHLTLVTLGAAGELVPCIPEVDEHLNYHYGHSNAALWSHLAVSSFDVSLDFCGTDRAAFMTFLAGANVRTTYSKRAHGRFRKHLYSHTTEASLKKLHTIDHMVALLKALGLNTRPELLRLVLPGSARAGASAILQDHGISPGQPYALVHAGTARREKYWRAERWAEVIDHLWARHRLPTVLTGGSAPEEAAHLEEILRRSRGKITNLAGKLSLILSASVISGCRVALGVDTAAMHLASAYQRPQVVLFGPTNPFHWRPRHEEARVVLSGHDGILEEKDLRQKLPERPMDGISSKQVVSALETFLN